jgi:hypothetical protein
MTVTMKMAVFWVVALCRLVYMALQPRISLLGGRPYCLWVHMQPTHQT